jgi:hypothetical protein
MNDLLCVTNRPFERRGNMTSWSGRVARAALTAVLVGLVVLVGVWVAGGVVTDDATAAKALTGGWFTLTGAAALLLSRSRRVPTVAVLAGWFVTATLTGGFLLLTSTLDTVVHEQVVMAGTDPRPAAGPSTAPAAAALEAVGRFRSGAHETRGTASLIRTPDGRRVVTLTGFETAPGPGLRVFVVPGRTGVDRAVDLGRLKGNKGDQQYVVPRVARVGSVVVWCRAFSVEFGSAVLRSPA